MRKARLEARRYKTGRRKTEGGRRVFILLPLKVFILILFIVTGIRSSAREVDTNSGSLSATLDRDRAAVGSIVELTLDYRLPEGGRIPEKPVINGLEGLTILESAIAAEQLKIRVLVDQLGPWKSKTISLGYQDKEGKEAVLKAGPVSLMVLSNLGEKPAEARLKPIQDIIPTEVPLKRYLPWAIALLVVIFAVGILWWFKRRGRIKRVSEYREPPHIRAKKEIEALEARRFFENGHIKAFYFGLSEILRRYLETLRHFPAAEFTTEEISRYVNNDPDRRLLNLLRQADLVKFADNIPTQTRKEDDIRAAFSYIRETGPDPENGLRSDMSMETSS
ncbi:hypothetical protein ACFL7M_15150 [Thermodesulfobacteriota bacterium]